LIWEIGWSWFYPRSVTRFVRFGTCLSIVSGAPVANKISSLRVSIATGLSSVLCWIATLACSPWSKMKLLFLFTVKKIIADVELAFPEEPGPEPVPFAVFALIISTIAGALPPTCPSTALNAHVTLI